MLLCVQSGKAPTIIHHHSSMAAFTKSLLPLPHFSLLFHSPKCLQFLSLPPHLYYFLSSSSAKPFSSSSSSTPYPLQYDMIISHPCSKSSHKRHSPLLPHSKPTTNSSDSDSPESQDLSFEDWVDKKLTQNEHHRMNKMNDDDATFVGMDKSKSKYYNKRNKRMYGSDSDDERRKLRERGEFVELKPQVVELRTLHKREEELFFYDTFAMPWEKDKHYKMVYQLEKKYFPDQCLDKAFLEPGMSNSKANEKRVEKGEEEDKGLVFFEEGRDEENKVGKDAVGDISEKKVEDFFKGLKKFPKKIDEISGVNEPFLASRSFGLPPKWDSPAGTVVLINKPKGWTSFTVCGKLRRLTKVKKVGHAGTLDPMATGLLIVCVGKATKVVDRYQGMIKGYSGVFRLGEATSTWDADSPVIQREPWEHIKDEDIRKAAASFTGEIWQVPPMFSAIKVGGEKMYDKARRGESIELSPRRISIFQFDIERSLEDRQNLIFRVTCSKGTYIRSLCADLGKTLGSCAHLTALRRDSIGEYTSDDAYEFQELEEQITKRYF